MDPKAKKFPAWSPYNYTFNNPVNIFDPDGMAPPDDYIFDQNGNFVKRIKNDKPDKIVQKNTRTGKIIGEYSFADPKNDPGHIGPEGLNKIVFPSNQAITEAISNAGAFDKSNQKMAIIFAWEESNGGRSGTRGGRLDFVAKSNGVIDINGKKTNLNGNILFITKTRSGAFAHNNFNFGNFLWGASTKALGFTKGQAKLAGDLNNRWTNGLLTPDSPDDQFSISLGFEFVPTKQK